MRIENNFYADLAKQSSKELNEVLTYMVETLSNEFPTDILTPEYLILSILDVKNCHANLILDNCLMSNNLEELRKAYVLVIETHMRPQLKNGQKMSFGNELIRLFSCANDERKNLNNNEIGTEHILLAILKKDNNFKNGEVFEKFRLGYGFILGKCNTQKKNGPVRPQSMKTKQLKQQNNQIPLKSQVNTLASSTPKNEFITKFTININELVRRGKIDDVIGRENETSEIIKVLSRRKKNNVVLVGNGGTGKTSIVNKLAKIIEEGNVPSNLEGKEVVMLNVIELVSGTHFRGMMEERVNGLFNELMASDKYIFFIDDIQNVLKNGNKEKDGDMSGVLGKILEDGKIRVIGTTTFKDYRNCIESDTSLSRKMQKIIIEPNTIKESIEILEENKKYYEEFHNVIYTDKAITRAAKLADRYIADRSLPDSGFDIIDLAGASTSINSREPNDIQEAKKRLREIQKEKNTCLNNGDFEAIDSLTSEENGLSKKIADFKRNSVKNQPLPIEITENEIAETVSEITNIPVSKLSSNEKEKLLHIDQMLKKSVVGQDDAINDVCRVIKRNKVGLGDKGRPIGIFLMVGKSGCGKTLIAKKLAEEIFGDERALVRIDMSEYSEKNSVSKLTGAAPGYIGYENGGQLTEAVKHKQHCVLLLDEIEKADQEVYNIFLQLFDEGRLTDSSGQLVSFKNVIVIMTSNIGTKKASELGNGIGFNTNEEDNRKSIIEKELKKRFTPEFLNRLDKIVFVNSLTDENLKDIIKLEINKLNNRLNEIEYKITYSDDVVTYIHAEAKKSKEFGARPIIRLVQNSIEDKITDLMLSKEYPLNYEFSASCINGKIIVT